jgi:hypothetical protein
MPHLVLALLLASAPAPAEDSPAPGCPPERAPDGETRLVFLGDSGYGEGSSGWGGQGQEAIAARIEGLRLAPDLVFFLGDNVYWGGSSELFKSRFDDMYAPVIRECKAHAALGNHDVKGCRTLEGPDLPGDATAYEDARPGVKTCNAAAALSHEPFGFGGVASRRERYYSVSWPTPRPLVDVIVLDSNTLRVDGGLVQEREGRPREDRSQLRWLRTAMAQSSGEPRAWKVVAVHHPPATPRGCACRFFGWCLGRHQDQVGLRSQLDAALEGLEPPDIVLAGHNHVYARSHALGRSGELARSGERGVRYFVTGGGGAPLYHVDGNDERFAKALTTHHFVYLRLTASSAFFWVMDGSGRIRDSGCFDKGSNVDHPLQRGLLYDAPLPPRCAPPHAE